MLFPSVALCFCLCFTFAKFFDLSLDFLLGGTYFSS